MIVPRQAPTWIYAAFAPNIFVRTKLTIVAKQKPIIVNNILLLINSDLHIKS